MQENPYHTYIAYRDNNAWTSERGASKFLDLLLKNGTLGKGDRGAVINGMKVIPGTGLAVKIQANDSTSNATDGHCIIKYSDYAYLCWQDADYELALEGASQSLPRISYIVAYIDRETEYVESDKIIESPGLLKFVEVKGSEATSPTPPSRTQIQSVVGVNSPYIILAEVRVNAAQSSIVTGNITDRRIKTSLSGDLQLDPENSYVSGFYQAAPNSGVKTRIVVTGPNAATPSAIPGVQLIWLRKKI